MTDDKLTIGSLFSGIGGLELGLEQTGGFETRWQCEINEYARKVLAKNWPGGPIYNDIKELYESEYPEPVDVLCGGFPCQPFSTAGKRRGESDERFLWPEFVRVIRQSKPRYVICENVPGLLTIDDGRVFGRILTDLASCGYAVEWDTISAASVGALHPRNRIFIVAYPDSSGFFHREAQEQPTERRVDAFGQSITESIDVADAQRSPLELGGRDNRLGMFRDASREWWAVEPDVGRVANGVPARVDRLRCLGNAVVPQCAQYIGMCILQWEGLI